MLDDPLLDVSQRLAFRRLQGQWGAELGLVSRPSQVHHQMSGDDQGAFPA
ncbi:hypothetical protein [Kibdelosporangium philippinense]